MTTASSSGRATPMFTLSCRFSGCSSVLLPPLPSSPGPTYGCAHPDLPSWRRPGLRQLVRFRRVPPCTLPTLLCEAERAAVGDAVHSAEHHPHAGSVQSSADYGETIPRRTGVDFSVAAGESRDDRQHPAVGLAAADGYLRAAAGDPYLLQVPRCRRRSLPDRWLVSAGDARGQRARALAAAGQRPDLGQPAPAVHPWQRGRHVPGHAEVRRRPADLLPEGHSAGCHRWSQHHRAAHLFRTGREYVRDCQRQHSGIRLSEGKRQRLRDLRRSRTVSRSMGPSGRRCSPGISAT